MSYITISKGKKMSIVNTIVFVYNLFYKQLTINYEEISNLF